MFPEEFQPFAFQFKWLAGLANCLIGIFLSLVVT
jgi:hypothetical protein